MSSIRFVVDRRDNGQTLAAVLKTRYGLSWSQAKRLIEKRHVKVSGQVETDIARRLKLGKRVEIAAGTIERPKTDAAKPVAADKKPAAPPPTKPRAAKKSLPQESHAVDIVYADDAIVVVNKPAGLTTMRHREEAAEFGERGRKFLPPTLADLLPRQLGTPGKPVIAVHRIDRDTSGLVVFARTRAAAEHLGRQFRKHTVDRRYRALTRGTPAAGRVESVLVRDRGDGRRGSSTDRAELTEGKRAVTHVKVIETLGPVALVECRLETGRTHQVRIHLGEAGAPLCGESVYDRPPNGRPRPDPSGANRPMLHAARLGFVHPQTGVEMRWEVAPPEDFQAVIQRMTGKGQ
jgi:23S rRNA pseudouridine1911/1915/1917 synthase